MGIGRYKVVAGLYEYRYIFVGHACTFGYVMFDLKTKFGNFHFSFSD